MRTSSRFVQAAAALVIGALLAGGGYAIGASGGATIHGCVVSATHQLLIKRHCSRGQTPLVWNQQGPPGQRGQTGAQGPPGAAAWATVMPGASAPVVLNSQNLSVQQDGNGVFTVTAGGSCTSAQDAEVVTPSATAVATNGVPVAYVVNPSGAPNIFEIVTGGLSTAGAFTQQNGGFSVAVFCKQS